MKRWDRGPQSRRVPPPSTRPVVCRRVRPFGSCIRRFSTGGWSQGVSALLKPPHIPTCPLGGVTVGIGGVPARRGTPPSPLPSPSGLHSARHRWGKHRGGAGTVPQPLKKLRGSVGGDIGSSTRVWGSVVTARALGRHSGRGCLCSGMVQQRAKLEKTALKLSFRHGSFYFFLILFLFIYFFFGV